MIYPSIFRIELKSIYLSIELKFSQTIINILEKLKTITVICELKEIKDCHRHASPAEGLC